MAQLKNWSKVPTVEMQVKFLSFIEIDSWACGKGPNRPSMLVF